ncbi:hypothetical protein F4553_004627 [Allocatelliglobosispora scoriae]|uniref:Uncharacterized protein n=1 Tax=Allocatelliglobosispora scoriae TaxID=643052 RepID=A0A841BUW9_9ACTN|nr:hypothetical protein [Allocatelliglobosispora scoriae]MBB5871248.1 hypothetical protein [Allocatelliglobosispora scoriae]
MTGPWQDYLSATQRLDAVRREAAEVVAAEAAALTAAREELPAVRARLALQHQRLVEVATAGGGAPPPLIPTQVDTAAANRQVAGGPVVVLAALRQARSTVDVADAAIAAGAPAGKFDLRPLLVYGPIALLLLLFQAYLLVVVDPRPGTLLLLVPCDALLAVLGWGIGWLLVAPILKTKQRAGGLGAIVCALPVALVMLAFLVR